MDALEVKTREEFAHWRKCVLASKSLSPAAKIGCLAVGEHKNWKDGKCNPSAACIARDTNQSTRAVERQKPKWREAGLLDWFESDGRTSSSFRLLFPVGTNLPGMVADNTDQFTGDTPTNLPGMVADNTDQFTGDTPTGRGGQPRPDCRSNLREPLKEPLRELTAERRGSAISIWRRRGGGALALSGRVDQIWNKFITNCDEKGKPVTDGAWTKWCADEWSAPKSPVALEPAKSPTPPDAAMWDGRAQKLVEMLGEKGPWIFDSCFRSVDFKPGPPPRLVFHRGVLKGIVEQNHMSVIRLVFGRDCELAVAA